MPSSQLTMYSSANPGLTVVDRFAGPWVTPLSGDTTEIFQQMPFAATLRNLFVRSTSSGYNGTFQTTYTVRVNGVDTALTCTIAQGAATYAGSDIVNSVSVNQNDRVSIRWQHSGAAGGSVGFLVFGIEVKSPTGHRSIIFFAASGASPSTSTRFMFPYAGAASAAGTTEFFMMVPAAGTLRNLFVRSITAPTGSGNITYTVRVDGVATALTCTVSHSASPHEGSDTSNSVAVAANARISMAIIHSVAPSTNGSAFMASLEFEAT